MGFTKTPLSDCEQQALITFLTSEGIKGKQIHNLMWKVYGVNNIMEVHCVYKWIRKFKDEGRTSTHDES